jgi:hypothetical protein
LEKLRTRFSLSDTISVIVILGTLSAFALPGFANVERESRQAALDELTDAMRNSAALVHAVWMATGANSDEVVLEGRSIKVNARGYPENETALRAALAQDLVGHGYVLSGNGFAPAEVAHPGACTVSYDPSLNPPLISSPALLDCE